MKVIFLVGALLVIALLFQLGKTIGAGLLAIVVLGMLLTAQRKGYLTAA